MLTRQAGDLLLITLGYKRVSWSALGISVSVVRNNKFLEDCLVIDYPIIMIRDK